MDILVAAKRFDTWSTGHPRVRRVHFALMATNLYEVRSQAVYCCDNSASQTYPLCEEFMWVCHLACVKRQSRLSAILQSIGRSILTVQTILHYCFVGSTIPKIRERRMRLSGKYSCHCGTLFSRPSIPLTNPIEGSGRT
jgi:hypothetical protein